jgi:hypothetical protein
LREVVVALDPRVKARWQEIQKKFDFPVSAIGERIKPEEEIILKIWKEEGIDKFMKPK